MPTLSSAASAGWGRTRSRGSWASSSPRSRCSSSSSACKAPTWSTSSPSSELTSGEFGRPRPVRLDDVPGDLREALRMLRVNRQDDLRVDRPDHLADLPLAEVAGRVELVTLQVEAVEPVLQHRIVHVVLLERLALRVDERGSGGRPEVHELREVPEVELDQELGRPLRHLLRRDHAVPELVLEIVLPRVRLPHLPVVEEEIGLPRDVGDLDVRVFPQGQEQVSGLRIRDELPADRLCGLEERPDAVDVPAGERDEGELVLRQPKQADRVL